MRNLFKSPFYKLVLTVLLLMSVNSSSAQSGYDVIGLNSEAFYKKIKVVIDSFQDYKSHIDKRKNKIFK